MAVRRESVVLALTDNFTAGMARAAAATKLLEHELDGLSGRAVRSTKSVDDIGSSADRGGKQIDRLSGRLALLTQAAAVLGPALVPIGAAAIPAVAGLSLQLGLAAGAAGVAVLAFQGIGDGLKALNAYQLKPSAENFAKLQQAMDKLGPAGQEFILSLDKMTPKFRALQAVAEQGLLPGVTDGLHEVIGLMPQLREVIFTVSSTLGDLARQGAAGLNGPEFQKFFDYLKVTARPVLTEMGQTLGNFVQGTVSMVMAFDPLSRSFSTGFLNMSKSFATWAAGLSQTQGFQDFLDYISTNGPRALDAIEALGNALLQIVEAAAPVGAVVLPVITALANGLAAIADSPAGPALLSTAAAVSVLARTMGLLETVGLRGGKAGQDGFIASSLGLSSIRSAPTAIRQAAAATKELTAAQREQQMAHARYIGSLRASSTQLSMIGIPGKGALGAANELAAANAKTAAAAKKVSEAEAEKARVLSASRSAMVKSAAAAAGLVVATSGVADGMGLTNTASFALMGTLAGPFGAAVGGTIGLVSDLAAANNTLEDSLRQASNAAANPTALVAQAAALKDLQATFKADVNTGGLSGALKGLKSIGSDLDEKTRNRIHNSTVELMAMRNALSEVYATNNRGDLRMLTAPLADVEKYAARIAPALQAAGISWKQFLAAPTKAAPAIRSYFNELDSATGKSKAVGAALADLGSQMEDTSTSASRLKDAMDSLFGVQLSQSAATDAWTQGLRSLRKQIDGTNGSIRGTSKAALANRAAIRDSVSALQDKVNADASAGASGRKLVTSLIQGRNAIIRQATAAGASKAAVKAYLAQLNLTPKNLKTIITTPGMLTAKQQVQALGKLYHLTPKQVHTLISQAGMGKSKADIDALAQKYHLTPKQVTTILRAIDQASGPIARVGGLLAGLNGRTATTFIRTVTQHVDQRLTAPNRTPHATGGYISGPGTATSDDIPAYLSNGEYVIRAAAVEKYGTHMFDRLNAMHFASGGSVKGGGSSSSSSRHQTPAEREHERRVKAANRELGHFKAELSNAANKLKDLRTAARDFRTSIIESFTHDIFGNGLAGAMTQLQADRNDANSMKAALAHARSLGLSANSGAFKALAQSGDLGTASDIKTRAQAKAFQLAFAQRTAATGSLARTQSNAVFGHALTAQTRELAHLRGAVGHLNKTVASLHKKVHDGAEKGTRAGIADQNKKVSQRRRAGR
jgi:hypothetical protein